MHLTLLDSLTSLNQISQYGSNLGEPDEDNCSLQDGVAPQCAAKHAKRLFIPNDVETKGFVGSHLTQNYMWIFEIDNGKDGFIGKD